MERLKSTEHYFSYGEIPFCGRDSPDILWVVEYRSQSALQLLGPASFCFVALSFGIITNSRMDFISARSRGGGVQILRHFLLFILNSSSKAVSFFTSVFTLPVSFAFLSTEISEAL